MKCFCVLSSQTLDALGSVKVEYLPSTSWGRAERRVTRAKTLDGGYARQDSGYTAADRTIKLQWTADTTTTPAVERLLRLYQTLNLATREAFYTVAPRGHEIRNNTSVLELLVLTDETT